MTKHHQFEQHTDTGRTDKIVALRTDGMGPNEIARRLNTSLATVSYAIRRARKSGVDFPPLKGSRTVKAEAIEPATLDHQIVIPNRLHGLLTAEAERVGKAPEDLARQILETGLLERWARHG
ncbi:sigma factor-like helix-turn-helix DNA-binding protein [uncultured Tateyamaria sp.]|uniref:sigma factor-like helix-turn-helix DNA-binding protein n=1 Tax=uncultured Tateyamaria sp. TaxID=455651 RepID=UPI0026267468|nr:sigma factor-like helix-turn-helix DNA-binding protein [uncultured Tateyamaria sp.]